MFLLEHVCLDGERYDGAVVHFNINFYNIQITSVICLLISPIDSSFPREMPLKIIVTFIYLFIYLFIFYLFLLYKGIYKFIALVQGPV